MKSPTDHYRKRAKEMRTVASYLSLAAERRKLLEAAERLERFADAIEAHAHTPADDRP